MGREAPKLFVLAASVDVEDDPDLLSYGSWSRFIAEIQIVLSSAGRVDTLTHSALPGPGEPVFMATGILYANRVEKAKQMLGEIRASYSSVQIKLAFVDSYEFV